MSGMDAFQKKIEMVQMLTPDNEDMRSINLRIQIYNRYADICDVALSAELDEQIIISNKTAFKAVCSDSVYKTILTQFNRDDIFKQVCTQRQRLRKGFSNIESAEKLIKRVAQIVEYNGEVYSVSEVLSMLNTFKKVPKQQVEIKAEETATVTQGIDIDIDENIASELDSVFNDDTVIDGWGDDDYTEDNSEDNNNSNDLGISEDELDKLLDEAIEQSSYSVEAQVAQIERITSSMADNTSSMEDFDINNQDAIRAQVEARDKAIQAKIDDEEEDRKIQELNSVVKAETESREVDRMIVSKTVNLILSVYDVIYAPLFQSTPSGILTSAGVLTIKSNNAMNITGDGKEYAIRLFGAMKGLYGNSIRELEYHEEISNDCINPDGSLKYNYIPSLQVRNVYGIYRGQDGTLKRETNWNKFRSKLVKYLTKQITNLMENFNGDLLNLSNSLVELFTTVYVAEDFDVNKSIKLLMKSIEIEKKHGSLDGVGKMLASGEAFPIDTSSLDLVDNSPMEMGVYNVLLVMDKKQYNGEVLFAYKPLRKILESGGSIGLQHTLLGRDIKGKNVTYNFESPQAVDSLIIAGSGSGKGVVTLNILATFIASGCPTVYVDWKPDMAAMLWNLERSTGARILAVDGLAGKSDGVVPVRNYGTGINAPYIPGISDKLNCLSYMKMFQIMVLSAKARNMNYNGMTAKGQKMQFILDEAQAMNKILGQLKQNLETFIKENKPTKERPETDEYKYVKKVNAMLNSMFSGAVTFRNTTGRTGNVGLIMLGQQSDCTAWATGALKRDTFGFLVGNCSMKMLGKDAVDGTKYSLNGAVPKGNGFLGNMGYFALIPQALADKSDPDKIKVVKSYLVLNDNDYTSDGPGKFTKGMLKNITDPVIAENLINEDFYPEDPNTGKRYTNPLVGFKGLIEYIGSNIPNFNLNANLEAGYREVEKLLSGLGIVGQNGRYSNIEEYVFDYSPEAIFTTDELADLMQKGQTIESLGNEESDYTGDGSGGFNSDASFNGMLYDDDEEENNQENIQAKSFGAAGIGTGMASTASMAGVAGAAASSMYSMSDEQKLKSAMGTAGNANTIEDLDALMKAGAINESQRALKILELAREQEEQELYEREEEQNRKDIAERTEYEQYDKDFGGYLGVTPERVGDITANLFGTIDGTVGDDINMVAAMLVDSVNNGEITPAEAEAVARSFKMVKNGHLTSYNFADGKAQHIRSNVGQSPKCKVASGGEASMGFSGKDGKRVEIDTEKTRNFIKLDSSNSIDARLAGPGHLGLLGGMLINTPKGAEKYMRNIWKSIMDVIIQQGNPVPTITRVSLIGGQISINGKIVLLDGVIGGRQNIRLKEIVNFRDLFKRFPMINELRIDEEMVQAGIAELGDDLYIRMFDMGRKLQVIILMEMNGRVREPITRQNLSSKEVQKVVQRNKLKNSMELHCKSKAADNNWGKQNIADNVWGMKLAKGSFSNAGEAFLDKKKPRMGKAVFYTGAGLVIGTVGGVAWGLTKVGKGLLGLSGQFRR